MTAVIHEKVRNVQWLFVIMPKQITATRSPIRCVAALRAPRRIVEQKVEQKDELMVACKHE